MSMEVGATMSLEYRLKYIPNKATMPAHRRVGVINGTACRMQRQDERSSDPLFDRVRYIPRRPRLTKDICRGGRYQNLGISSWQTSWAAIVQNA